MFANEADHIRRKAYPIREKWRDLRPEWRTADSPLKYVDWALEETITKYVNLLTLLDVSESMRVAEIGPGACFGLYLLKTLGVNAWGHDHEDRPLYRDCALAFDVSVLDWIVTPQSIPCPRVQLLYATQISWMNNWTADDGLRNVSAWLAGASRVLLFPNPQAFGGADPGDVWRPLAPVEVTMRHLGRGFLFTR